MLENVVEGLEQANAPLKHVYFTLGLKYYGQPHNKAHAWEDDHSEQQISLHQQQALRVLGPEYELPVICRRSLGCHQGAVR